MTSLEEYLKESIRIDSEDYRDLVNEESNLYRELSMTRERLEDKTNDKHFMSLIAGIRHELSENVDVQIQILANIRKNLEKLKN